MEGEDDEGRPWRVKRRRGKRWRVKREELWGVKRERSEVEDEAAPFETLAAEVEEEADV